MKYISVSKAAEKWGLAERSVRNYCSSGRVQGAILEGKTWLIPEDAVKPQRKPKATSKSPSLLGVLVEEKSSGLKGGIYHKIQVELTYNSNHIEGSRLTHDQTRMIFETNTIGTDNSALQVDDVIETANHFKCVDYIIDNAGKSISELHVLVHDTSSPRCSLSEVQQVGFLTRRQKHGHSISPFHHQWEL